MLNTKLVGLSFLAMLIGIFFTKPKIADLERDLFTQDCGGWLAVEQKAKDLTSDLSNWPSNTGEAKYVFRFTSPLIHKVLGKNRLYFFCLLIVMGFLDLYMWLKISFKLTRSKLLSFLFSCILATSYFGSVYYVDSQTPMNSVSYFLLTLAIYLSYSRYSFAFLLPLPFLFFNDERGAMAFGIIGIFLFVQEKMFLAKEILSSLKNKRFIALICLFISCFVLRITIGEIFGLQNPTGSVGLNIFKGQWKYTQLGLFTGVEGFFIPLSLIAWSMFRKRLYIILLLYISVSFLFISGGLFLVSDMTKTVAFIIPLSLLLLTFYKDYRVLKIVLGITLLVNVLFPTMVAVGPNLFSYYSVGYDILFKVLSSIGAL